jgi:cell division septal protein FtsQ
MRERRFVLRASWALMRTLVLLTVLVCSGYRGTMLIVHSEAMHVQHLVIRGNTWLSNGEALAMLDNPSEQSMLTLDLQTWRARLLKSPWVKGATLRRVLPCTVEVQIAERQPMGISRLNGHLYLVDEDGVLIDEYGPKYAEFDLPLIDGLARRSSAGRLVIDPDGAALAARLLSELKTRPDLIKRLSQVDVSNTHNAVVVLDNDVTVLRLGDEQFLARLLAYVDVAPALRERIPAIDYVDLRFGERVYIGPAPGAGLVGRVAAGATVAAARPF